MKPWMIIVAVWLLFIGGGLTNSYFRSIGQVRSEEPNLRIESAAYHPSSDAMSAAQAFSLAPTNENYMRVENILQALARQSGVTRYEIVKCLAGMGEELGSRKVEIYQAAGICAAMLASVP